MVLSFLCYCHGRDLDGCNIIRKPDYLKMAKGTRVQGKNGSGVFRWSPYPLQSRCSDTLQNLCQEKCSKAMDAMHWEDVTCSVCMECPHKAVLLLCASYDKGCRPYMCGTSFRYSNCLDQYKKAYTKVASSNGAADHTHLLSDGGWAANKCEASELACPLCRGQVKGWTVVEPAREYLNAKKRSCMQDDCAFVGTYKELRKHMRANHPCARPREVDPVLEHKWRSLEREREHDDVISTIRSSMPGALVFGDYVIERSNDDSAVDEVAGFAADDTGRNGAAFELGFNRNLVNLFLLVHAFGPSGNDLGRQLRQAERANNQTAEDQPYETRQAPFSGEMNFLEEAGINDNDENRDGGMSLVSRLRRHGSMLLGRSGRRRRGGEGNLDQR